MRHSQHEAFKESPRSVLDELSTRVEQIVGTARVKKIIVQTNCRNRVFVRT
jgi:hypothetical protein